MATYRQFVMMGIAIGSSLTLLSGCTAPAAEPEAPESEPEETVATPVTYPVPEGCPTGSEFGSAYVGEPGWAKELDAGLLNAALSSPLPEGGCGYVVGDGGTTDSGTAFERVIVIYYNIDTPGRPTHTSLHNWAVAAGGTPTVNDAGEASDTALDLPTEFSNFTNASFNWADGETSYFFTRDEVIPAFTQGANAKVEFYLAADSVTAMRKAADAGVNAADPTTALTAGLPLTSSVTFNAVDPDGYTAEYQLTVRMQPFTTDVTNAAPGEWEILSTSAVTGTVKNTTPQRNTETAAVNVFALYPMGAPACSGVSIKDAGWQDSSYCQITLGGISRASLTPGATQDLASGTTSLKAGHFPEGGTEPAVLNAPLAVYAALDPISMKTTTDWTSDRGCHTKLLTTSAWVIAMDGWPDPICQP